MSKQPPVPELTFIKISKNHADLTRVLTLLGIGSADVLEYAKHVSKCWYQLAEEHLEDAKQALANKRYRSAYSRSYYAAYNASKAVRYIVSGNVNLTGEDHKHASSDLPDDIPDVEQWSLEITKLYEHRLRADYDNWCDTNANNSIDPEHAVRLAGEFMQVVNHYILQKFGIDL